MSKNQNDELIFLDNFEEDGSVRRTYFKSASQLEDILQRGSYRQDGSIEGDSKEMDKTKDMWINGNKLNGIMNEIEGDLVDVPAVYLHSTHPEVKEALEATFAEDEANNVLRIDFEELFNQQTPPVSNEKVEQRKKNLVSFGTQTEDYEKSGICSKCIRCGDRTDVKIRLDFGDTPQKISTEEAIPRKPLVPLVNRPILKPTKLGFNSKVDASVAERQKMGSLNKRPLFRNKWQASSPPQIEILTKPMPSMNEKTGSHSLKKSYSGKFESKKKANENSDAKYFGGARSLDKRASGRKLQIRSQVNLSSSFNRTLEDNSASKFTGQNNRARLQKVLLEKSKSVVSLAREELEISLSGLESDVKACKRLPFSVDVDLQAISLAEDSEKKSYVWLRDQRGIPLPWSPIESLHD